MTVVGAAISIFVRGAAEFGHADENHVAHAVAHILVERCNSLAEILQQIRKLALHAAFVDVIVPAAAIEKSYFQANVRFEELGNFLKALAESGFIFFSWSIASKVSLPTPRMA